MNNGISKNSLADKYFKGNFLNEAAIIAAYPVGQAGWWANNQDTLTVWLWSVGGAAWVDSGAGATPAWGSITGTLSNQTDLQTALDNKASTSDSIILPPINGGGFAIVAGLKGYFIIPFACTINAAILLADVSTTTVVDFWKTDYANFDAGATHPVNGDSITAAAPLTITAGVKQKDSTLPAWTKTLVKGDIIGYTIDSNNNAKLLFGSFEVTRT